jgi:hypothetical protein
MALGFGLLLSALAYVTKSSVVAVIAFLVTALFLGVSRLSISATRDGACVVRLGVVSTLAFRWDDVLSLQYAPAGGISGIGALNKREGSLLSVSLNPVVRIQLATGPTLLIGVRDGRGLAATLEKYRSTLNTPPQSDGMSA